MIPGHFSSILRKTRGVFSAKLQRSIYIKYFQKSVKAKQPELCRINRVRCLQNNRDVKCAESKPSIDFKSP